MDHTFSIIMIKRRFIIQSPWVLSVLAAQVVLADQSGQQSGSPDSPDSRVDRVKTVTEMPGLVAFWDFVKRETKPDTTGRKRFVAHVPRTHDGKINDYALDVKNYVRDYWGEGRKADYNDFKLLGRGPFGQAVRINQETDPTFRPFLLVPRSRLHDTPLDIKGEGKSVSVVVWTIRESGNHALAGIWHEGTDLQQKSTAGIKQVERGQRQYALFAGLSKPGSACGHVSENGSGSFTFKYAAHKSNTGSVAATLPAGADAPKLDQSWHCFAMVFDNKNDEITAWLDGSAKRRWEDHLDSGMMERVRNAWRQEEWSREPGVQHGEDAKYPKDQYYHPPEGKPESIKLMSESSTERVELHTFRYSKVKVVSKKNVQNQWAVVSRDLTSISLNPWWFPHDIYSPRDAKTGGPFTIGRVIHSARESGYSGWIGGVAVFDRALNKEEIEALAKIANQAPVPAPEK